MEQRTLGGSDLRVPVLSLGTATFGGTTEFYKVWGQTDVAEATRLVGVALDAGITMFDTADVYSHGAAEEILGRAIAGRRNSVLISTKASFRTGPGPDDVGSSRKHLTAACEGSLRRLGIEHIDLWQMHGFDAMTPIEETLETLDDLVRAGKVRHVGCSNFSGWHLMKSLALAGEFGWPRYIAHQAYYSLLARDYEWELMPLALDQRIGTVVWSPLSGGMLSGKIDRDHPAPPGSRTAAVGTGRSALPLEQFHTVIDVLRAIAAETERTVAQVALNWVLQRPSVSTIIIGARSEPQLRETVQSADFTLTSDQVKRLDQASDRTPAYPYWHQRALFLERNPPPIPNG